MKFKMACLTVVCALTAWTTTAEAMEKQIECHRDDNAVFEGHFAIDLSDRTLIPNSGLMDVQGASWTYQYSSANMICNMRFITLNSNDDVPFDCLGFLFNGKFEVSGHWQKDHGQVKIHNIDHKNAYANQTEGMTLSCTLVDVPN